MKKILLVCLSMLLVLNTLTAAPKKAKKGNPYKDVVLEKDPETKKVYNFKGMNIIIGDWWSPDVPNPPINQAQEDELAYRDWLQEKYKFTMAAKTFASWERQPQSVANFCITGGEENYVFVVDSRSVSAALRSELFFDLSKVTDVDWSNKKWDKSTAEKMSRGGKVYGMRPLAPEPRLGLFFNKRLLQEAGVDPESIYDMQANGTWTWEAFEDISKKVQRDLDNDGIIDIYAMANVTNDFTALALASNGTALIDRDENGKLFNNANSPKALEVWEWIIHMVKTYEMPTPEGAAWDFMKDEFLNGGIAFTVDAQYTVNVGGLFHDMKDDYGFVCFPLGPSTDGKYKTVHDDNIYVVPGCYDDARAKKIVKAFDIYMSDTPGYDSNETWKDGFYPLFRDARAVDETLEFMRSNPNPRYDTMIAGFNYGHDFILPLWFGGATPQEAYEASKNIWQGLLDDANR
jgi:ABC-type glycerol-3-phosphate transport system substrate-binding protein